MPGATEATLIISNVALANAGPYGVRVSDSITTLTSSNATLRLLTKPTIIVPIQGQSVVSGGSVTFSVWAVPVHPTLPLTYRWLRGGTNYLTNTYSTFLASNVTNSTTYQVVVQNDGGTDYKPPVVLTVMQIFGRDPQGDGVAALDQLRLENRAQPWKVLVELGKLPRAEVCGMLDHPFADFECEVQTREPGVPQFEALHDAQGDCVFIGALVSHDAYRLHREQHGE